MEALKILSKEDIEKGITASHGRGHRFKIKRFKDDFGFETYILENQSKQEQIQIPRFIFDQFRGRVKKFSISPDQEIDDRIEFKKKDLYKFYQPENDSSMLIIEDLSKRNYAGGILHIHREALHTLDELLYHEELRHPNDVLARIIAYHKMFQFTFTEGGQSINSSLALRQGVLSHIMDYVPKLGKRMQAFARSHETAKDAGIHSREASTEPTDEKDKPEFKSKLSEKFDAANYGVNYELLFAKGSQAVSVREARGGASDQALKKQVYPVPLLASEVKNYSGAPIVCEFSQEDIQDMRDTFLNDRESMYFVGFEIVDAIFKSPSGNLKSFRFPLYYMPVDIKESGRSLILESSEKGRIYLNHVALAQLVETFTEESNPETGVDRFFRTLLAQIIEVDGHQGRVYLSRTLPFRSEIYDKTREILVGFPGESGRGGILSDLRVLGIEFDLESVYVYRTSKSSSLLTTALEEDLSEIYRIASEKPKRFYRSLLGKFLTPEAAQQRMQISVPFAKDVYIPEALPKSTKSLLDKLNKHQIVLLEGPPGTGKTHTIMNLFIHSVCSGKRVLIVSDQKAAIHALTEKIVNYLIGSNRDSSESKLLLDLYHQAVKVVDDFPPTPSLATWSRMLREKLFLDQRTDDRWKTVQPEVVKEISDIDANIAKLKVRIQEIMEIRLGANSSFRKRVATKRGHATTLSDIESLVEFLKLTSRKKDDFVKQLMARFIRDREWLALLKDQQLYDTFSPDRAELEANLNRVRRNEAVIQKLQKFKPKSYKAFIAVMRGEDFNPFSSYLNERWKKRFPDDGKKWQARARAFFAFFIHPERKILKNLLRVVVDYRQLLQSGVNFSDGIWNQLELIHRALAPEEKEDIPLSLEITRFAFSSDFKRDENHGRLESIQSLLEEIAELQKNRDSLLKDLLIQSFGKIANSISEVQKEGSSSRATQIAAMIDNLKSFDSVDVAQSAVGDLRKLLLETFPIWICRKQVVPLLFPCTEQLFDLVIVDEATQCRVDDALPLLFRAKKFMVVGDDKQTVLAKDSVIDDYLFHEFNLEEHLRSTQARGIKGGGSHIFGLVKSIRQTSVMLDEHYRCPPDIIWYSNHYVYNDELKTMQWSSKKSGPSVFINYNEEKESSSGRQETGQFKAIEIDMVDRFFDFIGEKIKEIEAQTGTVINLETDAAICYFLLKNEPYVRSIKQKWLQKMGRGEDILDGAGAALQGKEREYMFYLWDIYPGNLMAFKQGDDPDKRKGELNVLMSRPKKRAYHYLHREFKNLDHQKASIADYLNRQYQKQFESEQKTEHAPRVSRPGLHFIPWRRYSGQLILEILKYSMKGNCPLNADNTQFSVVVGSPAQRVDLMGLVAEEGGKNVAIVDNCGFEVTPQCADEMVDYFFQLKRAVPRIEPVFAFLHELVDHESDAFKSIKKNLKLL